MDFKLNSVSNVIFSISFFGIYQNFIKDTEDEGAGAVELEMANVVGVFYVLFGGSVFAIILDFTLILLETLKTSREMKVRVLHSEKSLDDNLK